MRAAIFSAFPQELRQTLRNVRLMKRSLDPFEIFFAEHPSHEILLVQAGMGVRNAEAALQYVLEEYEPDFIASIGFGGALYRGAAAGDLIWPSKVFFLNEKVEGTLEVPDAGEISARLSGKVMMHEGSVVTLQRWMKKSEIKEIMPRLPLPVCDMETFPLARLSILRGLPFFAVRSITDTADEEIPYEFLTVLDKSGKYALSRSLKLLLSKPKLLPKAARLGMTSRIASHNLWHAVRALVEIL
jgi:adenosylhomocysteine nucleosidase